MGLMDTPAVKLFLSLLKKKKEIPIIYQLGWWSQQQLLEVTSFQVEIVNSQLNVLNSVSVIRYTVKGWLHAGTTGTPYIRYAHHSERFMSVSDVFSEADPREAIHAAIRITPIVAIRNDDKHITQRIPFEFSNAYRISSLRWGTNRLLFSCGDIDSVVCLNQGK